MDRYLSDYEKLLHEYERIESKLNSLFIQTDLSESARKKLEISLKRRLKTLLPELRKKELEV
jgi:CHASE3 domain sensor protein|tara:strand:+ start:134 stop:319 length:186 start_codon:yes stop_codon:yes gene_type:complete